MGAAILGNRREAGGKLIDGHHEFYITISSFQSSGCSRIQSAKSRMPAEVFGAPDKFWNRPAEAADREEYRQEPRSILISFDDDSRGPPGTITPCPPSRCELRMLAKGCQRVADLFNLRPLSHRTAP